MARGIVNFLSVNQGLTNLGSEGRQLRLPTTDQFPKLDQRAVRQRVSAMPVVLSGETGVLPEMASDILGVDAGYAVENVKRDRQEARPASRVGLAHLVGRMLGATQPATRP